ncbi:uncharacterized protein LOC117412118 [Acipenser ruthenus]|uniref:uncharacterized protein LOC131697798 n=1 Tax=Acipenser ruthenus TaxID=7906 RepID=UPI00145A572D|nr:uncharacterized protein LOC131697798 [Acipenser ruthenus]XP_058845207.1 uncharacterized protein LOC131697805 [Acipenser ruthenus]XP_058876701.1 uncharacterized protein LOC117412118 [Acipenser ruthenus]
MASADEFAAMFYGEPGVLGLLANGISAFLVLLQNFNGAQTGVPSQGVEHILAGVQLILIGGVTQLLAGLLSFRKYDHLSGTAFIAFAALWGSYGSTRIVLGAFPPSINSTNITDQLYPANSTFPNTELATPPIGQSAIAGLIAYISISFILSFCSATVNYIMPFVFGAITLTLIFEAVGLVGGWALVVSGVLELVILMCGLYGAAALLLKGVTQRYILKGFGTPLFDVLLLGTANNSNSQKIGEEKKKNTQYAEPMALGYLCDTISPFIFAFFCFGYLPSFFVGTIWVTINAFSQLFSSYYAYLRKDVYHTTKFCLHSTYWLVKSWEEFVLSVLIDREGAVSGRERMVGDWFFLATAIVLCLMSLNMDVLEVAHNLLFLLLTVSTISQIPLGGYYIFFGVICSLFTALSLYGTFARLINSIGEKTLIPVGVQPLSTEKLQDVLGLIKRCWVKPQDLPRSTVTQLPDALFYVTNGIAALSAIHSQDVHPTFLHLTMPWVLIPGAIIQVYVSRLGIQKGRRFGPIIPSCYAAIWATWTWYRFAGVLLGISTDFAGGFTAGAVAFLVLNGFLMLIGAYVNVVLLLLTLVMEVIVVCFLLSTLGRLPYQLEIAMLAIFSLICLYGTLASLANSIFRKELLPLGPPLLKATQEKADKTPPPPPCSIATSRKTSGLLSISKLLDAGGVCGIPTDTVYALAASCKHPQAIEKIYNIKDRPQEKPICICISNLEQLSTAKPPFSPLLWEFMRNVYPGGISCIVKKGEWLNRLGVGAAYDRVGTKESIMIRVPDHTVTAHLCNMTGPLAITSANPSGEPDSTHHDMVITRLGHKISGVLCDGESNEAVGSTVVNCLKIDEGTITIIREGCFPAAQVRHIFEKVKNSME